MIILGTNSIKDTGFDVANSVRFNDGDDPRLKIANPPPPAAEFAGIIIDMDYDSNTGNSPKGLD